MHYDKNNMSEIERHLFANGPIYEACPESKDTKVLNMHNIFSLQKRHCE